MPTQTLAEKIEKILIDFRSVTPDVEGAVLVDMNGLPIISVLSDVIDDTNIAAMAAAMLTTGERTVNELKKGKLNRVLVQGENGYIIFSEAGKDAVLTVLTTKIAKLGIIFLDTNLAAIKIAKILSERA